MSGDDVLGELVKELSRGTRDPITDAAAEALIVLLRDACRIGGQNMALLFGDASNPTMLANTMPDDALEVIRADWEGTRWDKRASEGGGWLPDGTEAELAAQFRSRGVEITPKRAHDLRIILTGLMHILGTEEAIEVVVHGHARAVIWFDGEDFSVNVA